MSLKRTDTGEAATPLEQLQEMNEQKRGDLESNLLKEALAISNDRCNRLINIQNVLIEDLTSKVESLERRNSRNTEAISSQLNQYKSELRQLILDERNYKEKVSREIAEAVRGAANEVAAHTKAEIDKSTEEVKWELAECVKEIKKQRTEMKEQGLLRKIFFWATPVFLLVQTALLALALFF